MLQRQVKEVERKGNEAINQYIYVEVTTYAYLCSLDGIWQVVFLIQKIV